MVETILLLGFLVPAQDGGDIDRWIEELGSEDFSVRERAEEGLRRAGERALPELKKVAEDADPERAHRARRILKAHEREPEEDRGEGGGWSVLVRKQERDRELTFRMEPDGAVELTVVEGDPQSGKRESRTYRAQSLEEFKEKYPDVTREYDVEGLAPRKMELDSPEGFHREWPEEFQDLFRKVPGGFRWEWKAPAPFGEEDPFDDLFRQQERQIQEFLRRLRLREPGGEPEMPEFPSLPSDRSGRFGIYIEPPSDELRSRLNLKEGEGILVREVEQGSLAQRSGVREGDVLLEIDGDSLKDVLRTQEKFQNVLSKEEFELKLVRDGEEKALKVRPGARKRTEY